MFRLLRFSSLLWILFTFFFSHSVWAVTLTLDFSSRNDLSSATLVYNQTLGMLHPTLNVVGHGGASPVSVDVGDGRHGSFDISTYSRFSMNGDVSGNRIVIDTNQFPILQVTSFHLASGWTLEAQGGPLIIYSLTDVSVEGTIACHGPDGSNAVAAASGAGGVGRCGGGSGGDGGNTSQDGTDGEDSHATVTGGRKGNFTGGAAVAGGGGGSWDATPAPGNGANVNGGGGQAGNSVADPEFTVIAGGSGGGGGSGTVTNAGAGGGAGGGAVIIHTVRDFSLGTAPTSTTGFILVSGGDGGDSNVPGGAGGGGAGGSVQVFAGRNIDIYNTNGGGASIANGGGGGSNSLAANGGNGGIGRSWFTSVSYNPVGTGFYTPGEEAPVNTGDFMQFNNSTQRAESISYDLLNTKVTFNSLIANPTSTDFLVEAAGSDDDFISDDTGWTTDLSLLKDKRYVKLRASITTTNVTNPTMMDSMTLTYDLGNANQFDFTAASCARISTISPKPPSGGLILFLLPFAVLFYSNRKYLNT